MRVNKQLPTASSLKDTLASWQGMELIDDITLDSEAWFAWLEKEQPFRMVYFPTGAPEVQFNVRPERRKNDRVYWQGWKSIQGKTMKKYIGPARKVTHAKLIETGEWFYQQIVAHQDQDQRLAKTVKRLVVLVEELIEDCVDGELIAYAQKELQQIKQAIK